MSAKISVIIPVYNVEKYLRTCVDSVLQQTYKNLDIILVNDGSPDQCGAICDEYAAKDNRIRVLHKENGGLSDARNTGIQLAQGDYIYFCDSDDYIRPDAIEQMLAAAVREDAEIVYFDAETLYEDFEDKQYTENLIRRHKYRTGSGASVLGAHFRNHEYYSCVPLYMMKTAFLQNEKLQFRKGLIHEDELFTIIAFLRAHKVTHVHEALYIRRLRANSIMSERTTAKNLIGFCTCIKGYVEELKHYPDCSKEQDLLLFQILRSAVKALNKYAFLQKEERKKAMPYIRALRAPLRELLPSESMLVRLKINILPLFVLYKNTLWRLKTSIKNKRHISLSE